MRKLFAAFLCCFYLFFFTCLTAQEIPHFLEKLTTEDGLSSNQINDIAQDDDGFLWIATTDGLNRFDGTQVVQYFHQNIANANSITHNYVYCLKKLPGNYIAIGTQAGLDFYDGNTGMFRHFYYRQNSPLDQFNNIIVEFEMDTNGNLWVASKNCIFIFDKQLNLIKTIVSSFTVADAAKERLIFVNKMLPLANGNVLLYLSTGLKVYMAQTKTVINLSDSPLRNQLNFLNDFISPSNLKTFDRYFAADIVFKVFDQYFLCIKPGYDSLLLFNEQGTKLSSCYFPYNKYPYVLWSQKVAAMDSGRIAFLFHNYGLAIIPVSWQGNIPAIHQPSPLAYESHEYDQALGDREGNWWLATTEEGLQRISPGKQYFQNNTLIDDSSGAPIKYHVNQIIRSNNTLWISTYGNGFFEADMVSGKIKQHHLRTPNSDPWANFIWNIRYVNADTLWIGTQAGLFWYSLSSNKNGRIPPLPGKPPALDSVAITIQYTDSHGWVWMGLGKGRGACRYDSKTGHFTRYSANTPDGYPLRYPTNVTEDKNGNLWFVSDANSALIHWDRNTDHFKMINLPVTDQKQLNNLSGIWYDNDSTLWLGAITGGLIKYNLAKQTVAIYGHEKGLNNTHISSIFEDDQKRLWLVTDGDLSCFDRRAELFTNYSPKDGLPVNHATSTFYYDSSLRRLYAGGNQAFFYFDPRKMNPNQAASKTIITAVTVNGKPYMLEKDRMIKFKSWQNDIAIQYTAIDLTNGPKTKYAYKLVGEDTGWVMAGGQRQINFSRLAPGNYTFIVRASNNNGEWSTNYASIHFYIRTPFIQTPWFYILVLAFMGAIFYGLYRFRLRQIMRTEQIRSEISRNLHDEVGATLTNISLGSLLAQKQIDNDEDVSRILERIYQDSQHVSESMREIVWSVNPKIDTLGEALPRMVHYASELLEAKNIELRAEIASEIEHLKLDMQQRRDIYLIFKEALTNLAKHSKAKTAMISFHLIDDILVMKVSDDGVGFDKNDPLINNGLKNMEERARRHHWQLAVQSGPGEGVDIVLKAQIA